MSILNKLPTLYIGLTDIRGRGVFTSEAIPGDSLIEICPVIICPPPDLDLIHKTHLHDYYFLWGDDETSCAIALGYGSLYNHEYEPNARYEVDYEEELMYFYSISDIEAGDEITVSYNGDAEDKQTVWFDKIN